MSNKQIFDRVSNSEGSLFLHEQTPLNNLQPQFPDDGLHQGLDYVQDVMEGGVHNYCQKIFDAIESWVRWLIGF